MSKLTKQQTELLRKIGEAERKHGKVLRQSNWHERTIQSLERAQLITRCGAEIDLTPEGRKSL